VLAQGTPPVLPLVTESFKPLLACNPNTTLGMEGCGERRVLAADRELNADAKVISSLLHTGARPAFAVAQRAWIGYRIADCRSQDQVYSGGTEQPVAYVYCLAGDDAARRADLRLFYRSLTQGDGHLPRFP
jgi:uncharacterized protein YecT (DUF1311 family)